MRYLRDSEYLLRARVYLNIFQWSPEYVKKSFYRAANAVFAKICRVASEEVTMQLIKSNQY